MCQFRQCNLCDTGSYVGYTRGHLHTRVDGNNSTSSSVLKHYDQDHEGAVPEDLLSCFKVLKKCMNKLDSLVNEMLLLKQLKTTAERANRFNPCQSKSLAVFSRQPLFGLTFLKIVCLQIRVFTGKIQ